MNAGQSISRVIGPDSAPFLRVAAPITVKDQTYIVLVDEPLAEMEVKLRDSRNAVKLDSVSRSRAHVCRVGLRGAPRRARSRASPTGRGAGERFVGATPIAFPNPNTR